MGLYYGMWKGVWGEVVRITEMMAGMEHNFIMCY